jgi:CubicO group peptidase (beta-lactamase class C family)
VLRPVLLLAGCAVPLLAQEPGHPAVESMIPKIDALVERAFALGLTPALGVAVVMDGRTVYQRALGFADVERRVPATTETLWYVASTSKSFTGFGVALLEAAGELDLTAPITRILPNARWHPDVRPDELDLIAFLTHTHGLQGNGPVVMAAAFTGAVEERRWPELLQYHAPTGSRDLVYSNLGYNVAAMAIDAKRAEGWKAYVRRAVFEPAGMRETYAVVSGLDPARIAQPHQFTAEGTFARLPFEKRDVTMNSAGGHLSTLADLARWITVHMDGGMLAGRRVFPEAVVRRSHELLGRRDGRFAAFQRDGWGLGWDIGSYEGEPMVSRFGGYVSYRSHISFLPGRRVGVVAQVNGGPGSALTDLIAAYVYDLALGRPDADARAAELLAGAVETVERAKAGVAQDRARRAARPQTLPRPLTDYTGVFESPALGRVEWRLEGGALRARIGVLEPGVEVFDAAANQLRVQLPGSGEVVAFVFEGNGPATAVRFQGYTFTRR